MLLFAPPYAVCFLLFFAICTITSSNFFTKTSEFF
jgi:hypothetical protein